MSTLPALAIRAHAKPAAPQPPPQPTVPRLPRSLHLPFVLTAVIYLLAGVAAFSLAMPPSDVAPFFPAAGIGLASVLVYGWRLLPAVFVGSLGVSAVHYIGGLPPHAAPPQVVIFALVFAAASSLQAGVGAWLIRRWVPQPLLLEQSRDVFGFIGAATLACVASAVPSNLALWAAGSIRTANLPLSTAIWWLGDLLGVIVAVPIVLTLVGRPRESWAPRRLSVGVTLALVSVLLATGIHKVSQWHADRSMAAFDRDATGASLLLSSQLDEPLQALRGIHSVFLASDDVDRYKLQAASVDWVASGQLLALGWAEWVDRDRLAAFESEVRADDDLPDFRVFAQHDGTAAPRGPANERDMAPIRYIEPRNGRNMSVLGLDVLSSPPLRAAILATRVSGKPVASAVHVLTKVGEAGIVIYQAVARRPTGPGPAASGAAPGAASTSSGVVFTAIRLEQQLAEVKARIPSYLGICIIDHSPGEPAHRIAGPAACESAQAALRRSWPFAYASRDWELRVYARRDALPGAGDADVWLFALVGLLSTGMLAGFLLILTGRTRRIETAVEERTAALREEVRERELAQTELQETEQRFRNILNNVPMGICYTDLRGNVKQTNPRFCDLLGYREDELIALNNGDFTHPDDRATDYQLSVELIEGRIPMYRRHKRYVRANGDVIQVQATVTLLRDGTGTPRRLVGVVDDITEHMRLEDAERAREAAEASNRAKSEFLSRMSHELRTPLNAMLGFAQLLDLDPRQPLGATQRTWVSQIQQAGWHLLEMINDVLDLSRIESGNLRLQSGTLNLDELIESARAMVQGDAEKRGIVIAQDQPSGLLSAIGDATRVKQILINLLSNAVKYNADGGRIHIVSRRISEQAVEVSVSDSGLGMTSEQLAQLFQPFNRLGREKSNLEGTGIGLVISQRLAELMGGTLRASSVAGAGSTFSLTLPSETEPATIPADFEGAARVPAEYHRRLVHYVEDNETNVEVMRGILAQRPQVELEVSITGLDGLAAIRARRPDLILLDMHLPDISGMELLRHLKADARLASIPVVVVSADALVQQVEAAYEAGCANYLTKPVNIASLLHLVDTLLEELDTRYA